MVVLAEPDPSDMVYAIQKAIHMLPKIDPQVMHNRVSFLFRIQGYVWIEGFGEEGLLFFFKLWTL